MATAANDEARWRTPGWVAIVVATVKRFYADRGLEAAAALTYTSLLSLVPLLALMFAVLKGLGAQHRLEPLLLSKLSLDADVTARLLEWIDHTNVGTIGALGAVFLIFTVISVLGSIESIFNLVWRVRHGRTWWRKVTDYVSVVLLIPFLLLFAVGMTSALREQAILRALLDIDVVHGVVLFLLGLTPIAINVIALAMLYAVMPNRRPHPASIAVAALLAGCAWQVVQNAYVSLQIGVARECDLRCARAAAGHAGVDLRELGRRSGGRAARGGDRVRAGAGGRGRARRVALGGRAARAGARGGALPRRPRSGRPRRGVA